MTFISNMVETVNKFLWDYFLLFALLGTGIYYTFRLKFVQVRKFGVAFKKTFGSIKLNGKQADKTGLSSFQSFAAAVAAQVGTGNLVGAATALISGGPGAIFWMWVSAFFGMATIFAEAVLAQETKEQKDGTVIGGPVYYIKRAFTGKFGKVLAVIFSVLVIVALGFIGNMVQSNSMTTSLSNAFHISPVIIGVVIAVACLFVFLGGMKRIASITEKIVPIMAGLYILGSLAIIIINIGNVPDAFRQIFVGAFNPQAVLGGALGITVKAAVRFGVARGLFSNEAGMGSTPHAHALAKVNHPCDQGLVAMMGVFLDTFVILTLTTLVILVTGVLDEGMAGTIGAATLTQSAFESVFGRFGTIFIAISMFFFAFSTILGWFLFGETNVRYLFGNKAVKFYSVIVALFVVLGSVLKVDFVWSLADCFNGLMAIPNILAILVLGRKVSQLLKSYPDENDLKEIYAKNNK